MIENHATSFSSEPSATDDSKEGSSSAGHNLSSANFDADEVTAASDGFHVTDESSANWVVRKIIEARTYADRVAAWANVNERGELTHL